MDIFEVVSWPQNSDQDRYTPTVVVRHDAILARASTVCGKDWSGRHEYLAADELAPSLGRVDRVETCQDCAA